MIHNPVYDLIKTIPSSVLNHLSPGQGLDGEVIPSVYVKQQVQLAFKSVLNDDLKSVKEIYLSVAVVETPSILEPNFIELPLIVDVELPKSVYERFSN